MAYVSNEKRKEPFIWCGDYFKFETRYDLSGGINVSILDYISVERAKEYAKNKEVLAEDIACFIGNFMTFHYHTLNGFSGLDTLKWNFNF